MCALLLLILVVFAVSPDRVRGQAASFRLVGAQVVESGGNLYLLDPANVPYGWKKLPANGITVPPVPASSLVSYTGQTAITDSGEGWGMVGGAWTDLGPIPGLVPTTRESWGQLKAKYAR